MPVMNVRVWTHQQADPDGVRLVRDPRFADIDVVRYR